MPLAIGSSPLSSVFLGSTAIGAIYKGETLVWQGSAPEPTLALDLTTALDGRVTFSRLSHATMFDSTGKFTYAPNNIALHSEKFDDVYWNKFGSTVTADQAVAPDGLTTADLWEYSGSGAEVRLHRGHSFTIGQRIIFSYYIKLIAGTYLVAGPLQSGISGDLIYFNLTTGAVDSVVGVGTASSRLADLTYGITPVGSGWYRVWSGGTVSLAGTHTDYLYLTDRINRQPLSPAGVSAYIWGAQHELVTYETDARAYNPTTTAAYYGPRFDHDPATLAELGLLGEEARTNSVLHNRDLANAAWVKTNITAARNQVGVDGATNSASSITSTAANGTCLQSITLASSARFQSAYVKRITGSGAVEMTMDGGTTWTAVTVTSDWTRVSIPTQTLANPSVGFRIVTSGDAIAVDLVQNENGIFATSANPTSTVAVTRAIDSLSMTGANFSSWWNATEGTFVFEGASRRAGDNALAVAAGTTGNNIRMLARPSGNNMTVTTGGVSQVDMFAGAFVVGSFNKLAAAYKANNFGVCVNGGAVATDMLGTVPVCTTLTLFNDPAAPALWHFNGHVRSITYYPKRLTNSQLQSLTSP